MIDYSNPIFNRIAQKVWEVHGKEVRVIGEYVDIPKEFPCVAIDETYNIPTEIDSGKQKYAAVTYRVQVFSNKRSGKRAEAREIYSTVADEMYDINLMGKTYTTTPDVYNANIYQIRGTFEGVIREDGMIFRR
jgi:hypothetical protein